MSFERRTTDNFTFQVENFHALLYFYAHNECVVESESNHNMAKDASLLTSLDEAKEREIYVVDDFTLDIVGQGDVTCRLGIIFDVYHVSNLSANLLSIAQLT
jgi:hypothetical protein